MKPSSIQFGVDERPGHVALLGSAFQHGMIGLASLAFPLLVIDAARRAGQVSEDQVHSLMMMSFLALGVSTLLQCWRGRWVGSGFLIPTVFTAAYLPASIDAVQVGGLGLVFGMTLFGGLVEVLMAFFIRRFPQFFSPEVSGVVVLLVGLVLGMVGIRLMFSLTDAGQIGEGAHFGNLLALIAMVVAIGLSAWAKGIWRALAVVIGMVTATVASLLLSDTSLRDMFHSGPAPSFVWPIATPGFDPNLAFAFLSAALVCALRAVGDITIAQRINDTHWKRADQKSVCNGVVADGLGNVAAGGLGTVGLNTFSGSVGLSLASGITSRSVGFALAGFYLLVAVIPGLSSLPTHVPRPVLGAALLLSASFILTNAMQMIVSQALDNRKILAVSLAFFMGLSQHFYPEIYAELPGPLKHLLNSELTVGVLVLVILVPLFRLGTKRTQQTQVLLDASPHDTAVQFIQAAAAALGARTDMMTRAIMVTTEFIELAPKLVNSGTPVVLGASYDDFTLRITLRYQGMPMDRRPASEALPDLSLDAGEQAIQRFSVGLMTRLSDELKSSHSGQECSVQLSFR